MPSNSTEYFTCSAMPISAIAAIALPLRSRSESAEAAQGNASSIAKAVIRL